MTDDRTHADTAFFEGAPHPRRMEALITHSQRMIEKSKERLRRMDELIAKAEKKG